MSGRFYVDSCNTYELKGIVRDRFDFIENLLIGGFLTIIDELPENKKKSLLDLINNYYKNTDSSQRIIYKGE